VQPPYLTGATIFLRALVATDSEWSSAWHDSSLPITPARAEALMKDALTDPWRPSTIRLAIVQSASETVFGGVEIATNGYRTAWVTLHVARSLPDAGAVRAEAIGLLIPWLRDELEMMTVTVEVAADDTLTIAAANELGMVEGARLRAFVARPGGRVDLLYVQALNPRREVADGHA
jgi:hypothetical protein